MTTAFTPAARLPRALFAALAIAATAFTGAFIDQLSQVDGSQQIAAVARHAA